MTPKPQDSLLRNIWLQPESCQQLDERGWDLLVRQARHANLLGRLYRLFEQRGLLEAVLPRARNHMLSAATLAARQHQAVRLEAHILRDTLAELGLPLILLKGAAYVLAGLPAVQGRVFADVDILVPRDRLDEVESQLMLTGWLSANSNAYDQRYYRQWMHELPAMQHMARGSALDVHHTILPPTSKLKPDPALLIAASVEVPGEPGIRVLSPCDMVLHSAVHLFHEGEADNLLRDLSDLDLLLRHFGADARFWPELVARAKEMTLDGPLRLALRYAALVLGTPVPAEARAASGADRPEPLDRLYLRILTPRHSSSAGPNARLFRAALYVRGHWLRMPPHLLAYHLVHKALWPADEAPRPLNDPLKEPPNGVPKANDERP